MGLLDILLANRVLTLANRMAPVINTAILTAYALSGKRLSIIFGDMPSDQKAISDAYKKSARTSFTSFGGG